MGDRTGIEWTDSTWNPIRGCSRVSEGCRHCYAETVAKRFNGPGQPYEGLIAKGGQWNGKIKFVPGMLGQPLRWTRPRRIFVNSMSDLFHENVTEDIIDGVFAVMGLCYVTDKGHTFQILTKRPQRMLAYLSDEKTVSRVTSLMKKIGPELPGENSPPTWPLPNVWLGVSVEDQAAADERVHHLLSTPAAVRWISAEPLLGPIDLRFLQPSDPPTEIDALAGTHGVIRPHRGTCARLDWVVVGGESGGKARPMHPDWARGLRDQCAAAGVPFLFKQWGEWVPRGPESLGYPSVDGVPRLRMTDAGHNGQILGAEGDNDVWMNRAGKKAAGRLLDGVTHDGYPGERGGH